MRWYGYAPYQRFITRTRVANPALAQRVANSPQEFQVQRAATYGTNSPERASSTFIRRFLSNPYSRTTFVTIGNSQYWYPMGPKQLSQWLTSNSLGKYYQNYVKR